MVGIPDDHAWCESRADVEGAGGPKAARSLTCLALDQTVRYLSRISTGGVRVVLRSGGRPAAVRTSIAPLPGGERIAVDVDPDLLVLADAGLLDRVLANICENALKYTPVDARVRIDAAADGDGVVVRIADSGQIGRASCRERVL